MYSLTVSALEEDNLRVGAVVTPVPSTRQACVDLLLDQITLALTSDAQLWLVGLDRMDVVDACHCVRVHGCDYRVLNWILLCGVISPAYNNKQKYKSMDWLLQVPEKYDTELAFLRKMNKVTLYDHNSVLKTDLQNLTFTCLLNCKRLNRQYSILGKVQGDLFTHTVQISCALVDFNRIVTAKWQHQKIELMKFAYRYNQKSTKSVTGKAIEDNTNYQIKVNPLSGEFYVCYHFLLGYELINDYEKFKLKITDQCQKLTSEVQKIFNTIIEVIFDQEANEPYLKSDQKVGMHFSRPVKVSKLLKKIKKLNTISSFYKIRQDTGGQNKYKSVFKKIYLKKNEKVVNNPAIIENALLFIPKFCKKHVDALPETAQPAKRKNLVITPFEDLEDNLELQFAARHLDNFSKARQGSPIIEISNISEEERSMLAVPGIHKVSGTMLRVQQIPKYSKVYQMDILNRLNFKHDNIFQYYNLEGEQHANLRITEYLGEISLKDYLQRYSRTISLSTKLDIMTQICHVMEAFHRFHIGYFLDITNVYITEGNVLKLRGFGSGFSVACWDETRKDYNQKKLLPLDYKDYSIVCGYAKTEQSSMQRMEEQSEKQKAKFQNQKSDVFSLGMVLYRILLGKFPFSANCISICEQFKKLDEYLNQIWTVETEFFLRQGGMIVKLLAHLLLKCLYMETERRPYVEWITVILSEVKTSLDSLY